MWDHRKKLVLQDHFEIEKKNQTKKLQTKRHFYLPCTVKYGKKAF